MSSSTGSPVGARGATLLWWPRPVDLREAQACAALLPGEHDFSAFTPAESQHDVFVRIVREAEWERRDDHLHFTVTADSFLRHMVRTLVGTMLQAQPERFAALLDGRPRFEGGATAPPWGLYLERVEYGDGPRGEAEASPVRPDTIVLCGTASSSSISTAP